MRMTKILWVAVPLMFLFAAGVVLWGPGPKLKPEVKIRSIAVLADRLDPEDIERARQKIEGIQKSLESGANFERLATEQSEAANAVQGGDMGWWVKGMLPAHHEDIIFSLEPGQHSEIIKDTQTDHVVFRILYLEDRRNF